MLDTTLGDHLTYGIAFANPDNIENKDAKGHIELNLWFDLVADYEERHYPVRKPFIG